MTSNYIIIRNTCISQRAEDLLLWMVYLYLRAISDLVKISGFSPKIKYRLFCVCVCVMLFWRKFKTNIDLSGEVLFVSENVFFSLS